MFPDVFANIEDLTKALVPIVWLHGINLQEKMDGELMASSCSRSGSSIVF
jgi:hypothetical protein